MSNPGRIFVEGERPILVSVQDEFHAMEMMIDSLHDCLNNVSAILRSLGFNEPTTIENALSHIDQLVKDQIGADHE